jgi:S1-C subfamily serine protease
MTKTLHSPSVDELPSYGAPAGPSFAPPPPAPANHSGKKSGKSTWWAALAGGVVGAVVAGGVAFATVKITDDQGSTTPTQQAAQPAERPSQLNEGSLDIRSLLAKVSPSVVSIELGQAGQGGVLDVGAGSGVVISADGMVLTNAHVVAGADTITVKTASGQELPANLVGSAPNNDIALVKVRDPQGLVPATLGDSDTLQVGDEVVAIGNALNLGDAPTVTRGIVSAKNRTLESADTKLENLIQTDAAINRGNSGGPLLNAAGEVVGINSAGIPSGQNLGFAIEINAVKPLIQKLENGESPVQVRPFLGVSTVDVADLEPADRDQFHITATAGAVVVTVQAGSGAADAGVKVGDVITKIDQTPVDGSEALRTGIQAKKAGDKVTMELQRNGQPQTVTAELGSRAVSEG